MLLLGLVETPMTSRMQAMSVRSQGPLPGLPPVVATAAVVMVMSLGGASASAQTAPERSHGMKPIHRIALPAAAVGTVMPLIGLLPTIPMFRNEAADPNSSDDRFVYSFSLYLTTLGMGGAQVFVGAGIETAMAHRLERHGQVAGSRRPFGWALLGQSIGWVSGVLATLPAFFWAINTTELPPNGTRRAALGMHIAGPLVQAWGGSYLGAYLIGRHGAPSAASVSLVPVMSSVAGDPRSVFLGVAGAF